MRLIVWLLVMVVGGPLVIGQEEEHGGNRNPHGPDKECGAVVKVDCACPRIVHKIQQYEQKKCHDKVLGPKEMKQCLADAYIKTQHCNVMKNGHAVPEWDPFLREKGILKLCSSQCHHRKCRCADTGCHKMDENSGYQP